MAYPYTTTQRETAERHAKSRPGGGSDIWGRKKPNPERTPADDARIEAAERKRARRGRQAD